MVKMLNFRKENKKIFIILLIIALLSFLKPSQYKVGIIGSSVESSFLIDTGFLFLNIFLVNAIVAICIFYFGFFTGGLFSIVVWIWNIILFNAILKTVLADSVDFMTILYYCKHAPLEIYSFATVTFKNINSYYFFKNLFMKNELKYELLPNFKELFKPLFLLLCAAILESF